MGLSQKISTTETLPLTFMFLLTKNLNPFSLEEKIVDQDNLCTLKWNDLYYLYDLYAQSDLYALERIHAGRILKVYLSRGKFSTS